MPIRRYMKNGKTVIAEEGKKGRPKDFPELVDFVEKYIPSKLPMNWHHRLYYDMMTSKIVQNENGKLTFNTDPNRVNKKILTLAPRFHAKSQCFTINYPLWRIYKDPNVRIMIVSANGDIAVAFVRAVMNQLENNEMLHDEYGRLVPMFPKKWGEKAFIVNRDTSEKDPTLVGIGSGGKLISRRADIIIVDDLLDIENARTKTARSKSKEWFENVLLPILEDDGELIIAGTSWYKGDLYDDLWTDSKFDIRLKLKALMYMERYYRKHDGDRTSGEWRYLPYQPMEFPMALKAEDIFEEDVIDAYKLYTQLQSGVLWEKKWSFPKLMKKKEDMSNASFLRQYLNEATTEEERIFKEQFINRSVAKGTMQTLLPSWDNSAPSASYGHLITAIGVDLAISKERGSDNSAISVWGLAENRDRVLLHLDYGKWSPDETKQKILEAHYNYRPIKIRVESVAFQDMMRQDLANEDIPIEGFHTTANKKFSEESGIASIAMLMEQGKIILPSANRDKNTIDKVKQLVHEMSTYSYDQHSGDVLMSSWFALDALRDYDKKLKDNRGFFSTTALVEQMKKVRAAHRVLILGYKPPVYKFAGNSLIYIFRQVSNTKFVNDDPFIKPNEKFMIFCTREERTVAYIIEKSTSEIVGKIEGDLSTLMCSSLLEKCGFFFNNAQIIINRVGEGEAIFMELSKRDYPDMLCMQPDEMGMPIMEEGFKITGSTLPLCIDYFKQIVDGLHVGIPDEHLIKEMSELISVSGAELNLSFGKGQRIKTVATALWLLDNYENSEKHVYNKNSTETKKNKQLQVPYRTFNN